MKSRTFLVVFLAASLSLGMTATSFARGGGMGGSRGASGGSGFGGQGSFHSPSQGAPSGGHTQQGQNWSREEFQHRSQDQYRNRGETGGLATGNQQGRDGLRDGNNGNRYGQQNGGNGGQGETRRATPATPAQPGNPGEGATPAIPATPAGK